MIRIQRLIFFAPRLNPKSILPSNADSLLYHLSEDVYKKALSLNDVNFYESFQFGQRQLITGFVGNSFSFGPRKMLQYFSKYNIVYIHYNELYWVNLFTNKTYLPLWLNENTIIFYKIQSFHFVLVDLVSVQYD